MDVLDCKGAAYTFLDNKQETNESKKPKVAKKSKKPKEDEEKVT